MIEEEVVEGWRIASWFRVPADIEGVELWDEVCAAFPGRMSKRKGTMIRRVVMTDLIQHFQC